LNFVILWKTLKMMGIPQLLGAMAGGMASIATAGAGVYGTSFGLGGAGAAMGGMAAAGAAGGALGTGGQAATAATIRGVSGKTLTAKNLFLPGGGLSAAGKKAIARGGKLIPGVAARAPVLSAGARGLGMLVPGAGMIMTALLLYELMQYATAANGGYLQGMAGGGMAGAGSPYLVGEQGPELFMPGASGQLLNSGQTDSLLGGKIVLRDVSIGIDSFGGLA